VPCARQAFFANAQANDDDARDHGAAGQTIVMARSDRILAFSMGRRLVILFVAALASSCAAPRPAAPARAEPRCVLPPGTTAGSSAPANCVIGTAAPARPPAAEPCRTDLPGDLIDYGPEPVDVPTRAADAGAIDKPITLRAANAAVVDGRLSPEIIQKLVRQKYGVFRRCYEDGLRRNARLAGRVDTQFVIERDGSVRRAKVKCMTMDDRDMARCVLSGYRTIVFPSPADGVVTVTYPIMFIPDD
jgi:hypothetical protein